MIYFSLNLVEYLVQKYIMKSSVFEPQKFDVNFR